jgi:hypothetical protein
MSYVIGNVLSFDRQIALFHDCLSKISMLKYLVIMFVTFPITYDIDKFDQLKKHLDDGIGVHIDLQVCKTLSDEVRQDLILSGFVPKKEKSIWSLVQQLTSMLKYLVIMFVTFPITYDIDTI